VKDFFVYRTVRRLTIPLIVTFCVLLAAALPARAGSKSAQVEVGFVGAPPRDPMGNVIPFQNVLLNVQAVRINPKLNANPTGGGWQRIPTPPGIGGSNQLSELQIDLNASQNIPQLFNTAQVKPNTYKTVELLLDPNNPGTLIPNCPTSPSTLEGCLSYPITLNNGNLISFSDPAGVVTPGKHNLGVVVLQVSMMINQAPTTPGGAYLVSMQINPVPFSSVLGAVTGTIIVAPDSGTTGGGTLTRKVPRLAVTAEVIGTNTAIASARAQTGAQSGTTCPTSKKCFNYTLMLPAAGGVNGTASGFGTLYDLAVTGSADTYSAERLPPLYPNGSLNFDFPDLKGPEMLGNITGTLKDICSNKPIIGATLELLIPPNSNSAVDCMANPEECVTVATANTNNVGTFPLPGTLLVPAQFDLVPILAKGAFYVMKVSAPGYDNLLVQTMPSVTGKKNGGGCRAMSGVGFTPCNLKMNTGLITGSIPITPPNPGQTTLVEVFAEDHATNKIESALPMPIKVTNSNAGSITFTLNVPTSATVPLSALDLFAATIDTYQGVADPYQGHNIVVLSNVAAPAPPSAGTCSTIANANFSLDDPINCVGHGSIIGRVGNANLGSSVVLSKQDPISSDFVQITNSQVQNQLPNTGSTNRYGFCAPADTYQVQEYQLPLPVPGSAPSASPTPAPVDGAAAEVTIPPPPLAGGASPTPTPAIKCPTTCSNPDGTCPGICNTVTQSLPPMPMMPTATPTM
jgi:hypothetical protein